MVYGTAWSGSRRILKNDPAPLAAIIVLEQSAKNSIRKFPPAESIPLLLPRCFLPYQDQQFMDTACAVLGEIVMRLPIYHFKCRPDKDAVEVAARCLK